MTCPHCGYCSHCGRSNQRTYGWPWWQIQMQPYMQSQTAQQCFQDLSTLRHGMSLAQSQASQQDGGQLSQLQQAGLQQNGYNHQ